jgi:hypothetical protein
VERLIVRLVLIDGGVISELAYEAIGVKLNYLTAFRGGRLVCRFSIIQTRSHVKIIDWAPASWWVNAHACAVLLESSTNKVRMLFGKSRCHQDIDENLALIRYVAWDVSKLVLIVGPNKVDVVVFAPNTTSLIRGKVIDPIPFGSARNIKVQVFLPEGECGGLIDHGMLKGNRIHFIVAHFK